MQKIIIDALDVHVFMSDLNHKKWVDTKLKGTLKLVEFDAEDDLPFVEIVVTDSDGESILEYEIPVNFNFEPHLTNKFSAI